MAYKGFAGNGYVGNFLSTTALETQYPAQMHAGRRATVEATVGQVSPYFSDGDAWSATVQSTVNPLTGGISFLLPDGTTSQVAKTYTIAQLLTLTNVVDGTRAIVSDLPGFPTLVYEDATSRWLTPQQVTMAASALALVLPSSGSIANNGALTLTTALPRTFPKAWMYFPINSISASTPAGVYYVEMTSTTVGVIYNNLLAGSGVVQTPASKVPFVTTGPGAYTQTTGQDLAIQRTTIKGRALGANGGIFTKYIAETPNNANSKNAKVFFGNAQFSTNAMTSIVANSFESVIQNAGLTNSQVGSINNSSGYNGATLSPITGTIDTTADWDHEIRANIAVATDYLIISRHIVSLLRA